MIRSTTDRAPRPSLKQADSKNLRAGGFRVRFGGQNRISVKQIRDVHEKTFLMENGEPGQEYGLYCNLLKTLFLKQLSPALVMRGSIH